jgi:very-short-patch-repair endonuclease
VRQLTEHITFRVREFRKNPTSSEAILWEVLRNRKLNGKYFRRQHPIKVIDQGKIRYFIADFYCDEKKLVIELDGKIHESQKEYDEYRTSIINKLGIKVFRIKNEELQDITVVIAKIKALL